jgi:hypothetical protein
MIFWQPRPCSPTPWSRPWIQPKCHPFLHCASALPRRHTSAARAHLRSGPRPLSKPRSLLPKPADKAEIRSGSSSHISTRGAQLSGCCTGAHVHSCRGPPACREERHAQAKAGHERSSHALRTPPLFVLPPKTASSSSHPRAQGRPAAS